MTDPDVSGFTAHFTRPLGRLGIGLAVVVLVAIHAAIWWYANPLIGPLFASLALLPTGLLSVKLWLLSDLRHVHRELAKLYAEIEHDLAAKGQTLPLPKPWRPERSDWLELALYVVLFLFYAWDVTTGDWEKWFGVTFTVAMMIMFFARTIRVTHPPRARLADRVTLFLGIVSLVGLIIALTSR